MTNIPQSESVFSPYHEPKPWGAEFVWAYAPDAGYAAKTLFIEPGQRLSLQKHEEKDETIFVEFGPVWMHHAEGVMELETGGVVRIRPGQVHRFEAKDARVILFEVSSPQLDDVVRIEDDYDR